MRGSFSFDLLLASFLLLTTLGMVTPDWTLFVKGIKHSICVFLRDKIDAWHSLGSELYADVPGEIVSDSWIVINVKTKEVNIWDGGCE